MPVKSGPNHSFRNLPKRQPPRGQGKLSVAGISSNNSRWKRCFKKQPGAASCCALNDQLHNMPSRNCCKRPSEVGFHQQYRALCAALWPRNRRGRLPVMCHLTGCKFCAQFGQQPTPRAECPSRPILPCKTQNAGGLCDHQGWNRYSRCGCQDRLNPPGKAELDWRRNWQIRHMSKLPCLNTSMAFATPAAAPQP